MTKRLVAAVVVAIVLLAVAAFALLWFSSGLQDAMLRRVVAANLSSDGAVLSDDALHVVFCGTGSPMPDPDRAQACYAVYAGDKLFFIDAGTGGWNNLAAYGLPVGGVTGVLLTHFHSDHIGGLPDIALNTWAAGRSEELVLYGPAGIVDLAEGLSRAYGIENRARIDHHGEELFPPAAAGFRPVEVTVPDRETSTTVYDEDGLTITAFRVTHEPLHDAFGYRIDYKGRSVVFSGDTSQDSNLARFGKDADVLIHEALAAHMVKLLEEGLTERGDRRSQVMHDIVGAHSTPVQGAEIANEAGVKLLVYSHIVPRLPNAIAKRVFLRGVSDVRKDGLLVAWDGLHLELPVGSEKIVMRDLR